MNFVRGESVEKCIYSNISHGSQQLLILKVKDEEMYLVLKSRRKRGLKEIAKADVETSDKEDDAEDKDNVSISDATSAFNDEETLENSISMIQK